MTASMIAPVTAPMSAAANKTLIEQVCADAANRAGTTFIDSVTEDVRWIITGQYSWSHSFNGRAAVLNGLMGHLRSLLQQRARTLAHNVIAEGDFVVVEAKGDNLTKSGVRYDNDYCLIFRLRDGKITEVKEYCDSALVETVLGPFPASLLPRET